MERRPRQLPSPSLTTLPDTGAIVELHAEKRTQRDARLQTSACQQCHAEGKRIQAREIFSDG